MAVHRNIYDISNTELRYLPVGAKWTDYVEDKAHKGQFNPVEKTNKIPAMVIASTDKYGNVIGVQRTYLDKETANKAAFMDNAKLSKGSIKNGATLQNGSNGKVYIAEGIETGASVALADREATVLVSMSVSNMRNMIDKVKGLNPEEVILLKDNDGANAKTDKTFKQSFDAFKDAGLNVSSKEPEMLKRIVDEKGAKAKTDWNDVIQEKGLNGIASDLGLKEPKADKQYIKRLNKAIKPEITVKGRENIDQEIIKHIRLEQKTARMFYQHKTLNAPKSLSDDEKNNTRTDALIALRKSAFEIVSDPKKNLYLDKYKDIKTQMYNDAELYLDRHVDDSLKWRYKSQLSTAKIIDCGIQVERLKTARNAHVNTRSKGQGYGEGE